MGLVKKISRGLEYWEGALMAVGCVCAFAIMCLITFDVVGRNLFSLSNNGLTELVKLLLLAVFVGALPYVQRTKSHVILEFATDKASPKVKHVLNMAGVLLGLFLFGAIAKNAMTSAVSSLTRGDRTSGLVTFPVWPPKLFLAIVIGTMVIRLTLDFIMGFASDAIPQKNGGQQDDE